MEKYFVRTVASYEHILGLVRMKDGKPEIVDYKTIESPKKLGARNLEKAMKEHNLEGYTLMSVNKVDRKYAIPFETFMQYAIEIDDEAVESESEE